MDKTTIVNLLKFPAEWLEYNLYPDEIFEAQRNELIKMYGDKPVTPNDPEHFRYAAFAWWLNNPPSKEKLKDLKKLAELDHDKPMGRAIVKEIQSLEGVDGVNRDNEVES